MVDATKPTLTYFGVHARGEPIRMLLSKAGVAFNDVTMTFQEWGAAKNSGKYPTGQIPLWETVDGKSMNQAFAILRHLGRQHNFYDGSNIEEAFNVDWVLETVHDLQNAKVYQMNFPAGMMGEATPELIDAAKANFVKFHKQMENMLTSHGKPFIAGDRMTIADFVVLSQYLSLAFNDACEQPIVASHGEAVRSSTTVMEYLERGKAELADYMSTRKAYFV